MPQKEFDDGFTEKHIAENLTVPLKLRLYDTIDSTNNAAKELAAQGEPSGTVIIAREQSKGKGRLGRNFSSQCGGIYMSIILRPTLPPEDCLMITPAAAVAVCRAIKSVCNIDCEIKWVNDIFLKGKKICGILTESAFDASSGKIEYAVLGIGVNLVEPNGGFPDEIKDIAGAIYDKLPNKSIKPRLAAEILNQFSAIYSDISARAFMDEYRSRSVIIGKKINVIRGGCTIPATAVAIDDNAALSVRYDDGSSENISTGEVSVRLQK